MTHLERTPVIGIVPALITSDNTVSVRCHYTDAVTTAGGAPLVLPLTHDVHVYETLFPLIDGFLLTGGKDINPARYGKTTFSAKTDDPIPVREEVECLILSYADQFDIPVLGICRGMQMINVFFGGTLYTDLSEERSKQGEQDLEHAIQHWQERDYSEPTHFVNITRASKLGRILNTDRIFANSIHHQGVRSIGPKLRACAFSPDGLVEGIEVRDRTFIMGVQWHPEYLAKEKSMGCLFSTLVNEARTAKERRLTEQLVKEHGAGSPAAPASLSINRLDDDELWPSITFADCI